MTPGDPVGLACVHDRRKVHGDGVPDGLVRRCPGAQGLDVAGAARDKADRQGFPRGHRTPYAKWNQSLQVGTADWVPGMSLVPAPANGARWLVPLVVRSPRCRVAGVHRRAALTWQAYTTSGASRVGLPEREGGFGDRSRAVSFSGPTPAATAPANYLAYEQPVVALAERLGVPVSYVAASDLSDGSDELLRGAEGVGVAGSQRVLDQGRTGCRHGPATPVPISASWAPTPCTGWVRWQPDGPRPPVAGDLQVGRQTPTRPATPPPGSAILLTPTQNVLLVGMDYECYPPQGPTRSRRRTSSSSTAPTTSRTYAGLVDAGGRPDVSPAGHAAHPAGRGELADDVQCGGHGELFDLNPCRQGRCLRHAERWGGCCGRCARMPRSPHQVR